MKYRYVLLSALLVITTVLTHAADVFRVIDSRSGLCDNSVNCIRQDKSGMLWMATWNGLCRYDGMLFYNFQHGYGDESSMINNNVAHIEIGDKGIFVATHGGLDFLSFTSGHFERCVVKATDGTKSTFKATATALLKMGNRIFATDNQGKMYAQTDKDNPTEFEVVDNKTHVSSICEYSGKEIAAVGSSGIYLLSGDGHKVVASLKMAIPTGFKTNIHYSKNTKRLYVGGGIGTRTLVFAVKGNTIKVVDETVPADVMETVDYGTGTAFATDGHGLVLSEGGQLIQYTPANSDMSGDALYSVFVDKDNNLWVGSYRKGVNLLTRHRPWWTLYSNSTKNITHDIVTAVVPSGDRVYIGLDGGGLNIIDRRSGCLLRAVSSVNGGLPGDHIVSMTKDDKYLYMAAYTVGLIRTELDGSGATVFHMPKNKNVDTDNVWVLGDDGMGHVWVGGPDVNLFDKATNRITGINGLKSVSCSSITRHGEYMYIGSNRSGIYKVDRRTRKTVAHYSTAADATVRIPANDVRYVFVDSKGRVWFTSESSGFYMIDEQSRKLTDYSRASGLTSALVSSITEDGDGNLWLGTYNGLFRFNPANGVAVRFDLGTELSSSYTYGSARFVDGIAYFGSLGGLVMFNPRATSVGTDYGKVNFMALRLINEGERELPLFGDSPKPLTLNHDQNFFTLMFTVPDLYEPGRIRFACKLEGFDNGWRELAGRREVSYTNVPPGHYKFYVRCTDSMGRWSDPSVLEITVTPPWYATVWAKLLWTLIGIGVIVAGVWFYLHEMAIKNEVRISQIEKDTQRKLNEAKMNFYTNITHELRTPVFLIAAQLEELLDAHQSVMQVPSSYLQAMYRSAQKLNKLISRVIDFRKLDSGVLRLNIDRCDVAALCRGLEEDYEELCSQKDISFTLLCSDGPIWLECDAEKLEIILSNLVSNAFKYTKEGGHVELTVKGEADRVVFSVTDNGIGIIEKMRNTIFESFFRTERGVKQSGGDGLGLSFVKSLVELHEGRITVDSEVNVGSTFTFFIPRKETADCEEAISTQVETSAEVIEDTSRRQEKTPAEAAAIINPVAAHSVLVIDDEPDTVNLIERSLSSDYKVYKAYNGEEGMEILRRTLPDIVICDIMMPKMDGLAFLSTMKNDKTLRHIKVIIFTAKTSEEAMLQAYDNGADAYMMKPISLKVLRKRVDRLIEQGENAALTGELTDTKKQYTKEEQIFLLRCREIIDDNLTNEDFNIDFMADRLAMSHSALYKKVKTITGMSLIMFINDYKVYKAVQLFRSGMTNVNNVSEQCGFRDVKNFREIFKRKMNMTPKQFVLSL